MKKIPFLHGIIILACCLMSTANLFSQAPQAFKYQSIIRNAAGNPMANSALTIRATIHDGSAAGASVYQETHAVTTNPFGLINLEIGNGISVSGNFSAVNWGSGSKWIQIEADFGNGYLSMGTSQLLSVPYALYANNGNQNNWSLSGNTGTNPATSFMGTTDAKDVVFKTNNTERMRILSGGNIGIGTPTPNFPFHLVGDMQATTLSMDATASNARLIVSEPNSAPFDYHGTFPWMGINLANANNISKAGIIVNKISNRTSGQEYTPGIGVFTFSQKDSGGDISGILSVETGNGNAATFQRTVGSEPMPLLDAVSRQWGFAIESYSQGNTTANMFSNNDNGVGVGIGVGPMPGAEGVLVFPQTVNTGYSSRIAIRVSKTQDNLNDTNNDAFRVKMDGTVGINLESATQSPSAVLQVASTTAGFLPPRMTTAQRNAIASPAEGLQIYNLTTHTMNYYNGTAWISF